jgi:cytochrome c biogenesis protein
MMAGLNQEDRPADHVDNTVGPGAPVTLPRLRASQWPLWVWRRLTSMSTALALLLLLAVAAVPGSLFPQRSSDPNGVVQFVRAYPDWAGLVESLQLFTVYTSIWFSAIYLLLFVSLIGCVIPRLRYHVTALRQPPPMTPARLSRLPVHMERTFAKSAVEPAAAIEDAARQLRRHGYRARVYQDPIQGASVSAERGYLRETGNLLFHVALVGILFTTAIGGGFSYTGQRVVVEGQSFVNTRSAFDSFSAGRWFSGDMLGPFSLALDRFAVTYDETDVAALGMVTDYTAAVSVTRKGQTTSAPGQIRVNEPLAVGDAQVYLLGNGYAPQITIKDATGSVVFSDAVPFLPQDTNLTSVGVVKAPDGMQQQVGMIGFFYPTQATAASGAFYSAYPDLVNPVLTLNVYTGDLGLDSGAPKSVYSLDTSAMTAMAGATSGAPALQLRPGQVADLPSGLGTVELEEVKRFASFEVARDPTKAFILVFAVLILIGLAAGLFIPRRRVWVRATAHRGSLHLEYAGLARGDDPGLYAAVAAIADFPLATLQSTEEPQ